jgi:hypothetical protein
MRATRYVCIHIAFTWHFKAYTYINVRAIRDEETEIDEGCDKRHDVAGNRFGTRGALVLLYDAGTTIFLDIKT